VLASPEPSRLTDVPETRQAGGRRPPGWRRQVLFAVIIVTGLLLVAEAGVRTWALYFRTPYERYNPITGRPELVAGIRHTDSRGNEFWINSRGFVGPEFAESPAAGTYRIIALGDSCTFTTGIWRIGYPHVLERLLNGAAGRERFEVINAGIEGYNSEFALERLRDEIVRYRPHMVTIYVGWNDLMKVDPTNPLAAGKHRLLASLLERSYLVKAYRKLLFVHLRPLLFRPGVAASASDRHRYDDFVPRAYEDNLAAMIGVLREHGIRPVLLTLPTVVRPGMSQDELAKANVFFPYFAGTYSVDRFLSLHEAYNRAIRAVAERDRVPLVDLVAAFEGENRSEMFWDTMHPNEKGSVVIARAMRETITGLDRAGRL
jgi:lysophospholipase L1-like esterase